MERFEIDCRVRDTEGYRGTVRYIGPVAAAKNKSEIWLGVEWDNLGTRGKHDGSCIDENGKLHRYFECPQNSGSFVKTNKLRNPQSFIEALRVKYVEMEAPEIMIDCKVPDAFVMTSKGNQKSIEFVGEKKIRKWQQLSVVNKVAIRDEDISSIGLEIFDLAGHFTEIDLQDNLLYKWSEIEKLTSQIPNLSTLLLHGNKFQTLSDEIHASLPQTSFTNLRVLALNACNIHSWHEVRLLESLMPNIEELYLACNTLKDIPSLTTALSQTSEPLNDDSTPTTNTATSACPVQGFPNLRILDLSSCSIDSWPQILSLHNIPNLQELILDGNPLAKVLHSPSPPTLEENPSFPKLQRISLSSTGLREWSDIDALSSYSGISHLRLSHIQLFAGKGASEVRPKVIARMKNLMFFNGSGINPRERLDAEKNYLRSVIREMDEAGRKIEDFTNNPAYSLLHPRFEELYARYSHDLVPMGRVNEGLTLAADMITVTFRNMSTKGSFEPSQKKIPSSVTIARLRMMIKQMYSLDPRLQQLSIRLYKDSVPTLLDDDQANLQYFGAIDGAEIFINESKAEK